MVESVKLGMESANLNSAVIPPGLDPQTMHDTNDGTTRVVKSTINAFPLTEPLFTKVKPGTKKGARQGWKEPENLLTADEARKWAENNGNVGVALGQSTGDGWKLVVFDVEEEVLPAAVDKVIEEHVLAVWKSPHGGLNRLVAVTPDACPSGRPRNGSRS
jgi:hypothetical protein